MVFFIKTLLLGAFFLHLNICGFSSWDNSQSFVTEVEVDIRWQELSLHQQTILKNVIDGNHDFVLEAFQKNMADYNAITKHFDLLYLVAVQVGYQNDVMQFLFEHNVRVSHYIVGLSCIQKDAELCQLLLKRGVSPNFILKNSDTWLMTAIKNNNYKVVWALLEYGADKNLQNNEGKSSFDVCKEYLEDVLHSMEPSKLEHDSAQYIMHCLIANDESLNDSNNNVNVR